MKTDKKATLGDGQAVRAARKAYHSPALTEHGSLRELTTASLAEGYDGGTGYPYVYGSGYAGN